MKKIVYSLLVAIISSLALSSCTNDMQLESAIRLANRNMPQVIDEGLTCEKVVNEDYYVTYIVSTDEDVYPIDDIRESSDLIKLLMDEELHSDPEMKDLFDMCKKCNKGISYRYVSNQTGESFSIDFEPYEL
jgi:hypothetical protein